MSEQVNALAYIQRCQGDVLQLERERPLLRSALVQAWQQGAYAQVVQLMTGLIYLVERGGDLSDGERMLEWGIESCRQLQDRQHLAYFLNRLAGLACVRGECERAWQLWLDSQEVARSLGYEACLWQPLCQVAHIADLLGSYDAACTFADALLRAPLIDHPHSVAVALFIRGFYARGVGDEERACEDLRSCLRFFSPLAVGAYESFFVMTVQAELARAEGAYERSQGYAHAAIALARTFCEPYTVTTLLIDQMLFAWRAGMLDDARAALEDLLDFSRGNGIDRYVTRCELLLQDLGKEAHAVTGRIGLPPPALLSTVLSVRELDVLRYVAEGYANREIAARLSISVGTVKKHLEHISLKLDASSRTHAVARARVLRLLA